jgi:nitrogen fixation/metabolism regulation signal transduction histidine kinase
MSHSDVLEQGVVQPDAATPSHKRRAINAVWQPFLQFKLLMYMLGSTALVAVLLGAFLYFAFSDLVSVVTGKTEATSYYGEMIEIQLIHLFRYCGALFVLYILLLAAVCVAYTHRLIGPLRPFTRHVEALNKGDYSSRVTLRKGDLDLYNDYASKLNELAANLETRQKNT